MIDTQNIEAELDETILLAYTTVVEELKNEEGAHKLKPVTRDDRAARPNAMDRNKLEPSAKKEEAP